MISERSTIGDDRLPVDDVPVAPEPTAGTPGREASEPDRHVRPLHGISLRFRATHVGADPPGRGRVGDQALVPIFTLQVDGQPVETGLRDAVGGRAPAHFLGQRPHLAGYVHHAATLAFEQ